MTQYIGQITVILESDTPSQASETLCLLAKQLDDTGPEVVFADHNGDVEDYEKIERECNDTTRGKPYSVLLLYPDYANDGGTETYYAFITAADPIAAVAGAQRKAVAAQIGAEIDDPTDFHPLLVTQGHHYGEPLFNK